MRCPCPLPPHTHVHPWQVKEALAKCPPGDVSLRAFHPALVGFCMQRDPAGALEAIALVEQQVITAFGQRANWPTHQSLRRGAAGGRVR